MHENSLHIRFLQTSGQRARREAPAFSPCSLLPAELARLLRRAPGLGALLRLDLARHLVLAMKPPMEGVKENNQRPPPQAPVNGGQQVCERVSIRPGPRSLPAPNPESVTCRGLTHACREGPTTRFRWDLTTVCSLEERCGRGWRLAPGARTSGSSSQVFHHVASLVLLHFSPYLEKVTTLIVITVTITSSVSVL